IFTAPQVCGTEWDFINSSIGHNTVTDVLWRFGDGSTSNQTNPTHNFPNPNTSGVWNYTVELVVTNEKTCKDSMTLQIDIHDIPDAQYGYTPIICENGYATFTDSSCVGNTTITNWDWTFGDGNTSTQQNPTHIYTTAGLYPVQLIITSGEGCKDTIQYTMDVGKVPAADFPLPDACGVEIHYADSTNDFGQPITNWNWDFGYGSTSNQQHPTHLFPANGQYNVTLIVTNSSGCADTISKVVTAYDKPVANFNSVSACPFNAIQLFDQST